MTPGYFLVTSLLVSYAHAQIFVGTGKFVTLKFYSSSDCSGTEVHEDQPSAQDVCTLTGNYYTKLTCNATHREKLVYTDSDCTVLNATQDGMNGAEDAETIACADSTSGRRRRGSTAYSIKSTCDVSSSYIYYASYTQSTCTTKVSGGYLPVGNCMIYYSSSSACTGSRIMALDTSNATAYKYYEAKYACADTTCSGAVSQWTNFTTDGATCIPVGGGQFILAGADDPATTTTTTAVAEAEASTGFPEMSFPIVAIAVSFYLATV